MTRLITFLVLLASLSITAAGDVTLSSGRVLNNAQIGPIVYKNGNPSSLALKYQTSADIGSKEAVTKEVTEIWNAFRLEVEKGKYPTAVIMVVGPYDQSSPGVRHAQQRNFVFEQKGGSWKMILPTVWQEKNSAKS